jgi:hypothetical protein
VAIERGNGAAGTKKEAALPQHYLSPNQIKPNYNFYNKEKL